MLLVAVTASIFEHFFIYPTLQNFVSFDPHNKPLRWAMNVPGLHSTTWLGPGSDFSRVALVGTQSVNCRGNRLSKGKKTSLCMGGERDTPYGGFAVGGR